VVLDGSRWGAVTRIARDQFVFYSSFMTGRQQEFTATRRGLTHNVIGWWTNRYGIYWQPPRTMGPLIRWSRVRAPPAPPNLGR
jgi:hypothetical protein